MSEFDPWVDAVRRELLIDDPVPTDDLLDLARVAAHSVARPAAPLTAYLAGIAVGRAGADDSQTAEIIETLRQLAERWTPPSA